jgi:predicted molibdopterin-dependent oxidoreductase YjgC
MNFFKRAEERSLKALYAVGVDPVTNHADSDRLKKILQDLPLLVVQDLFMTETAKIAHVVLPACAFAEKGGTMTNLERRVQKLNPLRPPQGESRSDFDIFSELLRVLEGPVPGKAPDEVFERICQENPLYRGIQDGEQWPGGIPYLYADGFPTGKAKLIPVETVMAPPAMEGYPFCLTQRPSLFQSGLLSSRSEALEMVTERPHLEMNPGDAQRIDLADGETVQASAPGGRSLKMKVKYSSKVFPGVITVPYPSSLVDERGMGPVKIEKVHKK